MTIALALTGLSHGGTERQVVMLATGLARSGHRVALACLFDEGPLADELRTAGIDVFAPRFARWRDRGIGALGANALATVRYVRWLRRLRPDVVHSFLVHANVVTMPLAALAHVPVRIEGLRNLASYREGRRFVSAGERLVSRLSTHVVANSRASACMAVRNGADKCRTSVIANGVAAPLDSSPGHRGGSKRPVVACVANLRFVKGVDVLVEAAQILEARSVHATYVVVGEGPERSTLESAISRGTADVRLVGSTADPWRWMRAADVVVLPSRSESASNALLEAMSIGRAVVATDVGDSAILLGGTGVLVRPEDAIGLADAISALVADRARRSALARAARARACSTYTPEAMVSAHLALYRRLVR